MTGVNNGEDAKPAGLIEPSADAYRRFVAAIRDYAILMLDPTGRIISWNAGAEAIKGYAPQEIIGSHFSKFYPPEALARGLPEHELAAASATGRFEDEGWRLRKDGSRFWANVVITALRDDSGNLTGFAKITRDLSERRRHEEALKLSEERFRLLVEGVTEYALMMLDMDGCVTSWNAGAERIKGYTAEEALGKHFSHFYPSEDILANRPGQHLSTARAHGRVTDEGWRVRKDGTLFWASTVITKLHDSEGRSYGFAKVTQDLTQRRHAETLADTAQRMHEFIAMLAHELRNPLAPIRNAVALMGRKGLNDPTLEAMRQTIDRQSIHLTRLLDELLDVNRIARGKFAIEREAIDVRDVINRSIETCRPLIDSKEQRLHVEFPQDPLPLLGDAVRLTQVVVNLLNNAAKYTPPGGDITVSLRVRTTDLEIRVQDTGRGIDPAMLEKIFDLFVQVDANAAGAAGGLGVGLALVRRIIELHGGSVQARSGGLGSGSEFVVRLPLSFQKPRAVEAASLIESGAIRRLRVLVVDDNRDVADSLQGLLELMGQEVTAVYDGAAAMKAIETVRPALVLLDIGMPHMTGYEVARAINTEQGPSRPFLVAVTGWGQEADKQRASDSGFDRHFVKPLGEETLRNLLIEVSRRRDDDSLRAK